MTLKYTPISKRIQFAQNGRVIEKSPDNKTRANNTKRQTSNVYYDSATGQYTNDNDEVLFVVNRFGDNPANWTFSDSKGNIYNPTNRQTNQGEITQGEAPSRFDRFLAWSERNYNNPILGAPARYAYTVRNNADPITGVVSFMPGVGDAVDLASAGVSALGGNWGNAAMYATSALIPIMNGRMAKAIFQKAINSGRDLKQVFSSMPASAQKEILEDPNLSRQLSTLVGGNQGERVFYGSGPSISGMKPKKGMPFEGEPEYVTPVSEEQARIDDIIEFNRRNQSRGVSEQELPDVSQPETSRTAETYWDRVARQVENTPTEQVTPTKKPTIPRKPRKTKAQINEEKAAAAREVAEKARQEAFGKASRQYAALSDDEVMSSYREMAKSGKVDTPEYEAILQEGQARKMLDDNGRPISKSNEQKPASSSGEEPSTGTQEAANNTTKKTDNKKGWKENLKSPLSSTLQLIWETKNHNFNDWYQARNAGRLLGAGLLGGQRMFSGLKEAGPALWYGVGNSNKNDSTQVQTKTTTPGNQQTVERRDTTVAGEGPQKPAPKIRKASRASERTDWF